MFPENVRHVHGRVKGAKELIWARGEQTDFYDQPEQLDVAVRAVTRWFAQTLQPRQPVPRIIAMSGVWPTPSRSVVGAELVAIKTLEEPRG